MSSVLASQQPIEAPFLNASQAQLAIFYDTGQTTPAHLLDSGSIYCVGSQEPSHEAKKLSAGASGKPVEFIELRGRAIAPTQFQIAHDGRDWLVTRYGTTPVWLDNQELETIQSAALDSESVIKVPGATVALRIVTERRGASTTDDSLAWRNVQDSLHEKVLEEYRRRAGSGSEERVKTNEQMRDDPQFIGILGEIAQKTINSLPDETIASAVSWAVRKHLVAKVAGISGRNKALDDVPTQFIAQQLNAVGDRLARDMQLTLQRSSVNADLEIIKRDLKHNLDRALTNIPRGDKLEIAKSFLCGNIWDFIFNLGPVTDLMKLDVVTEIMVVRYDKIFLERSGTLEPYGYAFSSPNQLEVLTRRIANEDEREVSRSNAMVDFRLKDGSRVNVITDPLSINGPCITIRKHRREIAWTLDRLVEVGSMTQPIAWFLQACVAARKNIVISGGTGSGKTTLLNALSAYIPPEQRVVTIEDTAELILEHEHVVSLQARPANTEGRNEVSIRMLVKNALRMRPDRIVVGECRSGEAVDMLQALNTGHAGSMTTGHANSPADMLLRLEVMVLQGEPNLPSRAIRQQIASAVDIVVQINRAGGARRVTEIAEVIGFEPETGELLVEPIFVYTSQGPNAARGRYLFTGLVPSFVDEIYHHLPMRRVDGDPVPVRIHEVFL